MKHITKSNNKNNYSSLLCKNLLSTSEQKKILGGDNTYLCTGGGATLTCTPFTGSCISVTTDGGTFTCSLDATLKTTAANVLLNIYK
jgi:hypothetical protein